ncbi:MAG: ROK family protein [Fusobacteriaceae bacterium]|jgi:predicted NBD/HSP70 family sugar kinase|nr:ROK family protein [Fusobacteriaceae bacterium]
MSYFKKMDNFLIARTNKYNVFRCLVRQGPINRAAIARLTNLSIPTVMTITAELLEKKVIRSIGKGESSGGKPPEMLELVPDSYYTVGVDIGRTMIRLVANNAAFEQRASLQELTGNPLPAKDFVKRVSGLILRIIHMLHTEKEKIIGIGIAMPGLIEKETGRVIFSPDFEWSSVPLREWLLENLPFTLLVENANRALALNESYFEGEEDQNHTTFSVNLGHGIGAGLVLGEELYMGAVGASGEIGHITVERNGPLCMCGNRGCLEAVASGDAIAKKAKSLMEKGRAPILAELCGGKGHEIEARTVFEAAAAGDPEAGKIVDEAAEYIGMGLSMAINVLDPDRLILCGGLMRNGPSFFEKIKASIQKHKMKQTGRELVIFQGTKGENSTAMGACRLLVNTLWNEQRLPI